MIPTAGNKQTSPLVKAILWKNDRPKHSVSSTVSWLRTVGLNQAILLLFLPSVKKCQSRYSRATLA